MRKPSSREWVYLVILAVVVTAALWVRGGESIVGGGAGGPGAEIEIGEAPVVLIGKLAGLGDEYDQSGRDLFKYGQPPRPPRVEPPPRPVQVARPPPPPRAQQPVRQPTPQPQAQPSGPVAPKPKFTYLGFLGPKESRIAVFEQDEMILARTGDVVQKDFRVMEFKYETVVLGYTDPTFAGQTTELRIKTK